jgi:serine/threonine-protein kinase ATR
MHRMEQVDTAILYCFRAASLTNREPLSCICLTVIDWKRYRSQQKDKKGSSTQDRQTKEAKRSINVIDERLKGIYNLRNPNHGKIRRTDELSVDQQDDELSHLLPLSVEGQVHKMIAEATSLENLVQLYVGWMPWV